MEIADLNTLYLFSMFAVPGIIILYVRAQLLTGRMPPPGEALLTYVTVSLLYFALAFPVLPSWNAPTEKITWSWQWFLFVFVVPTLTGFVTGLASQRNILRRLLDKARIRTVHSIGSAWDWKFTACNECWVLVTLNDGTKWAGQLGTESFISSDPTERDIYIEKVYELDRKNVWHPRDSGVWISHSVIASIEFWPMNTGAGTSNGK